MVRCQEPFSRSHSPVPASTRSSSAVGTAYSSYEELSAALASSQPFQVGGLGLANTSQSPVPPPVTITGGSSILSSSVGAEAASSPSPPSLSSSYSAIPHSLPSSSPSCEYTSCKGSQVTESQAEDEEKGEECVEGVGKSAGRPGDQGPVVEGDGSHGPPS